MADFAPHGARARNLRVPGLPVQFLNQYRNFRIHLQIAGDPKADLDPRHIIETGRSRQNPLLGVNGVIVFATRSRVYLIIALPPRLTRVETPP